MAKTRAMTKEMDWNALPFFLAVARTGSLRAAADQLGGTHATVNRRLQALETAYGVRLFDRTRQGLSLTLAGEELMPLAEAAEGAILGARSRLQGLDHEAAGLVRISIPPFLAYDVLTPIFARFSAKYPEIDLKVMVTNRRADFARLETDVSVRVAYDVQDDVVGRRLLETATGIFASQSYIDENDLSVANKGTGLKWIGWGPDRLMHDWIEKSPFPRADIGHSSYDIFVQTAFCSQGLGLASLPFASAHYNPDLVQVPGTDAELNRSVWLLLHSDLRRTKRVRLLVDYLADEIKKMRGVFLGPLA